MKRRRTSIYRRKRAARTVDYYLARSVALTILGVLVCTVCLVSTTWAWFTASIESKTNVLKAANYGIEVVITQEQTSTNGGTDLTNAGTGTENSIVTPAAENENSYNLMLNVKYTVRLTANGDAAKGYCVVKVGDEAYYTPQIAPGHTFIFSLIPSSNSGGTNTTGVTGGTETAAVSFAAYWGSYSDEENVTVIAEGQTIGSLDLLKDDGDDGDDGEDQENNIDSGNEEGNAGNDGGGNGDENEGGDSVNANGGEVSNSSDFGVSDGEQRDTSGSDTVSPESDSGDNGMPDTELEADSGEGQTNTQDRETTRQESDTTAADGD